MLMCAKIQYFCVPHYPYAFLCLLYVTVPSLSLSLIRLSSRVSLTVFESGGGAGSKTDEKEHSGSRIADPGAARAPAADTATPEHISRGSTRMGSD